MVLPIRPFNITRARLVELNPHSYFLHPNDPLRVRSILPVSQTNVESVLLGKHVFFESTDLGLGLEEILGDEQTITPAVQRIQPRVA